VPVEMFGMAAAQRRCMAVVLAIVFGVSRALADSINFDKQD
jgi:hypothetical protein